MFVFKKLTALVVCMVLMALAAVTYSPPASASPNNLGPGYYFASFCGYYGPAQSRCVFGLVIWFGPFTTAAQCNQTVQQMVAYGNPLVVSPYAPSNCIYYSS